MALIGIILLPLVAALLCSTPPCRKVAWSISVFCLCLDFLLAVIVAAEVLSRSRVVGIAGWIEADALSALMLILVSFVALGSVFFARDYMRHNKEHSRRLWWFYCNMDLFAFALVVTPCMTDPNLAWVGVELITLFGVLLVAFERSAGALEAAWKFSVLTIIGAPISLLGFLILFWAYRLSGTHAPETWATLGAQAASMPPTVLRLGFLLVFVGFGAKTGLAPMHTWLPDAHSQAPSPACAVLSAVKTSVPLYVILRLLAVLLKSSSTGMGRWMIVIGLLSVTIAAFLLLQVHDYKRMFAYSTVEHMGIILTAAGLATRASDFGAVSQMLNHSITKSLCFYVAGTVLVTLETREIKSIRGLLRVSPFMGVALLFCSLAIAGAPPFPIFLSEYSILSAGLRDGHGLAVAILASLIVLAFVGIMLQVNRMAFGRQNLALEHGPVVPTTCRIAVIAAALPVAILGIYIPGPLHSLLQLAAQQLGGR